MHQVLELITERARSGSAPGRRDDPYRIALSVEGGAMRGTISAGMALALHELGLVSAFDAVYGASAGAITGAWLLSSTPEGLRGWADPDYARTLIRWSALLRGRPVVDVRTLIEDIYTGEFPMDFDSVLASDIEYHPLGTDAETGESTDLRALVDTPASLRLALRASASLPFLAGPPIALGGRRFYDAGVAESVPFRTPLAQGATHVLVLRSKRGVAAGAVNGEPILGEPDGEEPVGGPDNDGSSGRADNDGSSSRAGNDGPGGWAFGGGTGNGWRGGGAARGNGAPALRTPRSTLFLTRTALRKESEALRNTLIGRPARGAADAALMTLQESEGKAYTIFPPADVPPVSRLTTDQKLLEAALESGRKATRAAFEQD